MNKSIILLLVLFITCCWTITTPTLLDLESIPQNSGDTSAPETIYYFYFKSNNQFNFGGFSLTQQKEIIDVVVPYSNNILIYNIVSYDETSNSFLVAYFNGSTETDNLAYYSLTSNTWNTPISQTDHTIPDGYYITSSAPSFDFQNARLFLSILDFNDSNLTIFEIDFYKYDESRLQFPVQGLRQGLLTPSGVYNQRVGYYYSYYIDADTNIPSILVYETEFSGNFSIWEFNDWAIDTSTQVFLLHTKNYVEGRLYALALSNSEIILYSLAVMGGEAKQVLSWNIVPGSASLSDGVPYFTNTDYSNDYIVLRTQPSQGQYLYTTIDLWTLQTTSFTSTNNIPWTFVTYSV